MELADPCCGFGIISGMASFRGDDPLADHKNILYGHYCVYDRLLGFISKKVEKSLNANLCHPERNEVK